MVATGDVDGVDVLTTGVTLGDKLLCEGIFVGAFTLGDDVAGANVDDLAAATISTSAQFQKFSEPKPHDSPGVGQLLAVCQFHWITQCLHVRPAGS